MKPFTLLKIGGRLLRRRVRRVSGVANRNLDTELLRAGISFDDWWARRREQVRQYIEISEARLQMLKVEEPDAVRALSDAAEQVLKHRFDLLGSGPFVPVDPERAPKADGYQPIDWYLDPVRTLRFPRGIQQSEWKLFDMRPGDADIKYPWELARCQHLVTLGQAWRLFREPRFAIEISRQIDDFLEVNPTGVGINWTCTMDVAIRAANWCMALASIKDCGEVEPAFWRKAYEGLFDHGKFIYDNLENIYEVTSNHYLSNVVGLHFIAAEFRDLPQGERWNQFSREAVEKEIGVQVLSDGADFESSVPYHRLVVELFLGSARLARLSGEPLSERYQATLTDMIDYLLAVMRPDGLMPQLGDADDGRLHIFSDYATWVRQDGRHILAAGAVALGRNEWLSFAGPHARWEATWWGADPQHVEVSPASPPNLVKLFPEAGVFIARDDGDYLAVTNGQVGTEGFGNHKHNDLLGFEFHAGGVPLLVDPGSYVYTSDFSARNLFRSTAYHNTLQVDGEEQNELNPEWLFRLIEKAKPEHVDVQTEDGWVGYRGRHVGYTRLKEPIVHERTFKLWPGQAELIVTDTVSGAGEHDLRWHFHGAPGVEIKIVDRGCAELSRQDRVFSLLFPQELEAIVADAWYSPGYGNRLPVKALDVSTRAEVPGSLEFRFSVSPVHPSRHEPVERTLQTDLLTT